ncbi:hypothetical protein TRFO_24659 [Tritrichomonas foetus]|uniref:Uncharacterized protein n=1 Tax=Tritrichomonas foetus TaxID=1144522 RepID=A0A1J4K7S6_9EUKA|nr:hypothetical protein TRFO_24659 [Tritrichomonas foetus]|eukprot:OHT07251.1 hypothetical protein TRFO_24659 [Tritrichomonas foetus]
MSTLSPMLSPKISPKPSPRISRKQDATPTVYIKLSENPENQPKKILLPRRMAHLMENCIKIYQQPKIKSILDEKGFLIESIHDIEPGSTIYLSTIDPAFIPRDPKRRPRSPDIAKNVSTPKKEVIDENQQQNEIEQKEAREKKALLEKKKTSNSPTSPTSPTTPANDALSPSTTPSKKFRVSPITKIDMRKITRPPSSSDDDDDDDDDSRADAASMSTKLTAFLAQHEDNSSDEETEEIRRHREEKRRKKMLYQSVVSIQDPKNQAFQQLIEEIIPPQDAPRLIEDGLDLIASDRKKFIQMTSDLEGEQLYLWIKGASDQPFLKRYPMQPYHDPITGIVTNFLTKHRHIAHKQYEYRFKAAVIGPKKSGKSTLLGNAVDNYLLDLAATGLWKSTFILAIDFKQLSPFLNEYQTFYNKLLDLTLDALSKQRPVIRPDLPAIRRQLKSAVENRSPLLGIHHYREIDVIAKHINEAWRNEYCFCSFLNHVCLLPVTLSKAVGMKHVSLFVDNFEYADVNLYPHEPFDSRDGQAIFIEHMKYALNHANFILSGEKSEKLFQILPPFDEDGVDLSAGIDYITPFEATSDLGSRLKYDFLIECHEEPQPIRVDIGMCGGVVPYVAAWDELHHSLFVLERTNKDNDQYEDMKFTCITDAQTLIDLIFVCENSRKITVVGVKRDKRGNDFQLRYDDGQSDKNTEEQSEDKISVSLSIME